MLVDELREDIQTKQSDMEEKGYVRRPVYVSELHHQLREKNQRKVAPEKWNGCNLISGNSNIDMAVCCVDDLMLRI